jgi:hypothetical protein
VALLEKRRFLYNHSGDFPQVILIVPSHVPNSTFQSAAPLLLPLLWVEDPLGKDHEEVDGSHAEDPAPESRHSAHDCLRIKGTVQREIVFFSFDPI